MKKPKSEVHKAALSKARKAYCKRKHEEKMLAEKEGHG